MKPSTIEVIKQLLDKSNPASLTGWCWLDKAMTLCRYVETEKPSVVVELGIFGGASMIPMAIQLRDNGRGVIFGIDPWTKQAALEGEHAKADSDWWAKVDLELVMRRFMGHVVNLGLSDIAVPIRGTSHVCAALFPDDSIDILHVDSNHSELVSMKEVATYFPKVKTGGIIILDDLGWPSNAAAVRELDSLCTAIQDVKGDAGWCRLYRKVRF